MPLTSIERLKTGVLSIATAVLLLACGARDEGELIAAAKTTIAKGDARAAAIQLKSALQQYPNSAEARFLLGKALLADGEAAAATVEFEKARELKADEDRVMPLLARALLAQGQAKRLIESYGQTRLHDPAASASMLASIAEAYLQLGQRPKAEASLALALKTAPKSSSALMLQARLSLLDGEVAAATAAADKIIAADPNDADGWFARGLVAYYGRADSEAALSALRRSIELDSRNVGARVLATEILIQGRDLGAVKDQIAQLRKLPAGAMEARYFDARMALAEGDLKRSYQQARDLLARAPDNVRALQLAGVVAFRSGNFRAAETHLSQVLQFDQRQSTTRLVLAKAQLRMGQPDKALKTLSPLIEGGKDAEALTIAANAYLFKGDKPKAEEALGRAASLDPKDLAVKKSLALAKVALGKGGALSELESIATADPGTDADLALIGARLRKNDLEGAMRAIDALDRKQPGKPYAAAMRGQLMLVRNDDAAARKYYEQSLAIDPTYFPAVAGIAALDMRANKPVDAAGRIKALLAVDPKMAEAWLALADITAKQGGKPTEVTALIEKAVAAQPANGQARVILIEQHLRNSDFKSAISAAQAAVASLPYDSQVLLYLGIAQARAGEHEQAIASYNKLAGLEPLSPVPYMRLADVYQAMQKSDAARRSLRKAIELDPDLLDPYLKLIALALGDKSPDEAIRIARMAQQRKPQSAVGWMFEGDIERSRQRSDAALAAYRMGLQKEKLPTLAVKLYALLLEGQRAAEATRFANQWLAENPRDTVFMGHLADRAISKREYAEAESRLRGVVAIVPNNVTALNNLAFVLVQQGKPGALAFAEQANRLQPGVPSLMDTLAMALLADGQTAKAAEVQKAVLAAAPGGFAYHLTMAKIHIAAGEKDLARSELERLAKLGDRFDRQAEVAALMKKI